MKLKALLLATSILLSTACSVDEQAPALATQGEISLRAEFEGRFLVGFLDGILALANHGAPFLGFLTGLLQAHIRKSPQAHLVAPPVQGVPQNPLCAPIPPLIEPEAAAIGIFAGIGCVDNQAEEGDGGETENGPETAPEKIPIRSASTPAVDSLLRNPPA